MLNKETLRFLEELTDNNVREWFDENRDRYQTAKADVAQLVEQLIAGITEFDGGLVGTEAKKSMFRIFRDVRFSKNKAPYKTNMGAWMARDGRKSPWAGYYLHIEPGGKSFLAGGCYMPPSPILKGIREAVDYEPEALRAIIADAAFQEKFGELEGAKLKTAPKGYDKELPHIDLLRHKSFVVSQPLSDKMLTSKNFIAHAQEVYQAMLPLNTFLNKAIGEVVEEE